MNVLQEFEVTKLNVSTKKTQEIIDCVAEEKALDLYLNRIKYATFLCSPSNLKELATGHLLSEGIINGLDQIKKISLEQRGKICRVMLKKDVDIERRLDLIGHVTQTILSACGGRSTFHSFPRISRIESKLTLKPDIISSCVNRLNVIAEVFKKTGGVHVAAIYHSDGKLIASAEDVGRHNAVDKAIGAAATSGISFGECFVALSGRLTSDIVLKVVRVGVPVLASLAAATDTGITLARSLNLTLVGFVRGKRMNIYSLPDRILS